MSNLVPLRGYNPWTNGQREIYFSVANLVASDLIPDGRNVVFHGGLPIHFELQKDAEARSLVVVFQGAKSDAIMPPYVGGIGVTAELQASKLFISDPSLFISNDLNLAWYAGNVFQPDLQCVLNLLIKKTMKQCNASNVILVGGSGGGFASLEQSSRLPGSTVVVWNPQTDIERYNPDHVAHYFTRCWFGDRELAKAHSVTSLIPVFAQLESGPTIYYFQSASDTWHIEDHLKPFVASAAQTSDFNLLIGDWGQGHVPPAKEVIAETLVSAVDGNSVNLSQNIGFVRQKS